MKIYTRVVIDMQSLDVLEEEHHEYHGPVSLCGGSGSSGGSSTTNTVDYAYNARMASLSEEQQDWARDYYNMWQTYTKPYEIAQAQANLETLPMETNLYKNTLSAASNMLPQQAAAGQQFLTASTQGVDVNERMALATADAANAWKDTTAANNRAAARLGVNPNSGRYQGIAVTQQGAQAAQLAGAKTQARVGAEQENYDRLKNAASYNPTSGILQGIGALKG